MDKKKVLVSGCNGHMGKIVCRLVDQSEKLRVLYGFDKSAWEFSDFFPCVNLDDIDEEQLPDIIIDFSAPEATMQLLDFAKKYNIPLLVFGISDPENIVKAVKGEKIGTIVS